MKNINEFIVDLVSTQLTGVSDNVNIHIPTITGEFLNIHAGDKVFCPGKSNPVKRKVLEVSNGCITVQQGKKRWIWNNEQIAELNNVQELKYKCELPELCKTEGTCKTFYQFVASFGRGEVCEQPFSLCFLIDKGYYSDWVENAMYRTKLANSVKADYIAKGKTLTEIL
jgi:hypothetical protein